MDKKLYQNLEVTVLFFFEKDVITSSVTFVGGEEGADDNAKAWGELFE